jgi:hypothetical protein
MLQFEGYVVNFTQQCIDEIIVDSRLNKEFTSLK